MVDLLCFGIATDKQLGHFRRYRGLRQVPHQFSGRCVALPCGVRGVFIGFGATKDAAGRCNGGVQQPAFAKFPVWGLLLNSVIIVSC